MNRNISKLPIIGLLVALAAALSAHALASDVEHENRGIYILGGNNGNDGDGNMRDYDFVEGFTWRYGWDLLQSDATTYDFSPVDNILEVARANGKKVTIYIFGPEPEFIRTALPNNQVWTDPVYGRRGVPWSPSLLGFLEDFAVALANHTVSGTSFLVKDHPSLKTISFGLQGADKWIRDPDPTKIHLMGSGAGAFSRTKLLNAVLSNLHDVTDNFPGKVCSIGFWKIETDGGNPELYEYLRQQILLEFDGVQNPKVGFFEENLATHRVNENDPDYVGQPTTTFAQPLYDSQNDTFIGFQMVEPYQTGDPPVQFSVPSEGVQYGLDTFSSRYAEIYIGDIDEVHCNSTYDQALKEWNDELTSDFHDNFEDGNATGWTTTGGSWAITTIQTIDSTHCSPQATITNYVFQQSSTTTTNTSASIDPAGGTGNYSFEAKVTSLTLSTGGGFGISARATNNSNRYYFKYLKSGQLQILKYQNGSATTLNSKSYSITPSTTHRFKADLNGSTLDFYVDDVKELTATDSTFSTGQIALSTSLGSAYFDKVRVIFH